MVFETSAEKQQPAAKKMDDLFGFLMEPTTTQPKPSGVNAAINPASSSWADAFGFLSQASSKEKLSLAEEEQKVDKKPDVRAIDD